MDVDDPVEVSYPPEDRPVGRRALLGMLGLGVAGVLWGAKAQSGMEAVLRPVTIKDRTGLTGLLPSTGRFRIYTVTGNLPQPQRRGVPPHRRGTRRPAG